jgi:hypothetical protein
MLEKERPESMLGVLRGRFCAQFLRMQCGYLGHGHARAGTFSVRNRFDRSHPLKNLMFCP